MNNEIQRGGAQIRKTTHGFVRVDVPPSAHSSHWAIFFKPQNNGKVVYIGYSYTYNDNPDRLDPPHDVIQKAQELAEQWLAASAQQTQQLRLPF